MIIGRRGCLILVLVLAVIAAGVLALSRFGFISSGSSTQERSSRLEDFQSLPYLSHVEDDPDPGTSGVTLHDRALASRGLNLLTSMEVGGSHLLDMNGNVLHSWTPGDSTGARWLFSEMDREGNLTVLVIGLGLVKLNWDSEIIWISRPGENPYLEGASPGYHHDMDVTGSGNIHVLASELRMIETERGKRPKRRMKKLNRLGLPETEIRDNSLVTLDSCGTPLWRLSFYDLLCDSMAEEIRELMEMAKTGSRKRNVVSVPPLDIFHANTVEEIRQDIGVSGKGDLLFCIRNLNLIGAVDPRTLKLKWSWGPGIIQRPHHPSVLPNGNILIFDNGTRRRGYSRIVEMEPGSKEIIWTYEADPREDFFTPVMGSSQRLPNGNTLVTESTRGRVFEVTHQGDKVWEFLNFETSRKPGSEGKRATIYRMTRYGPGYLTGLSFKPPE